MLRSICVLLVAAGVLTSTAFSQQPGSAGAALTAFESAASRPEAERATAARALGRFADARVTKVLLDALAGATDPNYRAALADALGAVARDGVVEPLGELLVAPESPPLLRSSAARGLARQGDAGVERLRVALAESTGSDAAARNTRTYALMGLSQARTEAAWNAIAQVAASGDVADRRNALRYLDQAPDLPAVTEARLAGIADPDLATATTCARQLAEAGHPAAYDALVELCGRAERRVVGTARADLIRGIAAVFGPAFYECFLAHAGPADTNTNRVVDGLLPKLAQDADFVAWLRDNLSRRRPPAERQVAIRVLGHAPGKEITLELAEQVRAREPEVVTTALRVLADRGDRAALPALKKLLRAKDEARRIEVLLCVHTLRHDDPEWREELLDTLKSAGGARELGVRTTCLDLLADLDAAEALPVVWKDLDHREWTVRAAVYDFCRKVRHRDSVPKLIARLDEESGRLREDVLDALQALTALRFAQTSRWERWWDENRAGFQLVPEEAIAQQEGRKRPRPQGGTTSYYGIPLVSDRVVFVVDVSGSMSARVGTDASRTRLDEAKRQLTRVVEAIPDHFRFNIVWFHTTITPVLDRMSPAGKQPRVSALDAIRKLQPTGGTNVHGALERAFAERDVDTIYLLSDGSPTAGEIVDPTELADEIARWNRTRQIRIHCISIGTESQMLKRIAAESGGEYAMFR